MTNRAAAVRLRRAGLRSRDTADCELAGRCDRLVPDMPACRQRAPGVSRRRLPPLRLRSPFKSAPAYRIWTESFHDSDAE